MEKYFANLRPMERRLVMGVAVAVVLVLNWWYIWPHFSDWGKNQSRFDAANFKLATYTKAIGQIPDLQRQLGEYEKNGDVVAPADQGINLISTIQTQSARSGVALEQISPPTTHTNDVFFIEQWQNVNVLAPEEQLVDFLYQLGNDASMIRVRDLTLQPDVPHMRLTANMRLVASYQKTSASNAKNATAKAK